MYYWYNWDMWIGGNVFLVNDENLRYSEADMFISNSRVYVFILKLLNNFLPELLFMKYL